MIRSLAIGVDAGPHDDVEPSRRPPFASVPPGRHERLDLLRGMLATLEDATPVGQTYMMTNILPLLREEALDPTARFKSLQVGSDHAITGRVGARDLAYLARRRRVRSQSTDPGRRVRAFLTDQPVADLQAETSRTMSERSPKLIGFGMTAAPRSSAWVTIRSSM